MSIRRARLPDGDVLAQLYVRARGSCAAAGTIPPLVHSDEEVRRWVQRLVLPRLECWVAERGTGDVVGMLVLDNDWIDQLYVEPDLTYAGVGAQLLTVAKRERPDGLRLWTFVSNDGAQRFYERHGFHEVERTDGSGNEERAPDIQYQWLPT